MIRRFHTQQYTMAEKKINTSRNKSGIFLSKMSDSFGKIQPYRDTERRKCYERKTSAMKVPLQRVCVCLRSFAIIKGNLSLRKVAWNFPKETGQVYAEEILSECWKNGGFCGKNVINFKLIVSVFFPRWYICLIRICIWEFV